MGKKVAVFYVLAANGPCFKIYRPINIYDLYAYLALDIALQQKSEI